MKDTAVVKDKKTKPAPEKSQIRRWILKSVAETTPKTAITLYAIKKFLDSKQNGISNNPETKLILRKLLESGNVIKINGKFAFAGKPAQIEKQQATVKSKKRNETKNLTKSKKGRKPRDITEKEMKSGKEAEMEEATETAPIEQETDEN
ncbi:uncharacterized protein TNIN_230991 [Trichonephila inaurata madagascariensis]|uniref:Histone H1 n=1 Tax=Trichonephila inaurata madagascariensis TaxID=2747483 RepID=A0A8X7BV56_9ARAC|nr:uncharacterized protein TNIN_230991 [Trichonephila inaurata madagascariensis]